MNNQSLELMDIYDISYNPWWLQSWFMYSVLFFCMTIILGLGYFFYMKNKKVVQLSAEEKALQQLTQLKKNMTKNYKEFYNSLTPILKQFFQDQYYINVIGATDAEFLQEIIEKEIFPDITVESVKAILDGVTLIKFANKVVAQEQVQEALRLSFQLVSISIKNKK